MAQNGALVEGLAAGPATFPFTLYALHALVSLDLGLPLIASGGIGSPEAVALCFEAGAVAIQVRSLLWTDPAAAVRLALIPRITGVPDRVADLNHEYRV